MSHQEKLMQIYPYLFFDGQCEEALAFYAELMNGRVSELHRYRDMPADTPDAGCGEAGTPSPEHIMHMQIEVAGHVLMGSDASGEAPQGFSLALSVDSREEAERLCSGLAEGGEIMLPLSETFWAERFALVKDRFGVAWMVMYEGARGG
ncbi:VOC family protein [Halomonas sp. DP1Y21-3]|uniref:VOC family protein n=1 Tax=Halomonas sp. DP1Y21-3 TaxID=2859080 RepID=UPI001C94C461|nr:VOC family protein [Halomonas sp. DP1Y21-3]MBY6108995.1 VOC family protein [Halomonas sp. DP1Y21-3]